MQIKVRMFIQGYGILLFLTEKFGKNIQTQSNLYVTSLSVNKFVK